MKISKSHKLFSEYSNNSRVLTHPEEFLGPNYKAILDFWMILDELTKDQWKTIRNHYWDFYNNQRSEWDKATDEAYKASNETIGENFAINATYAAWDVSGCYAAYCATRELIAMHKILEDQQQPLIFFPMFINL